MYKNYSLSDYSLQYNGDYAFLQENFEAEAKKALHESENEWKKLYPKGRVYAFWNEDKSQYDFFYFRNATPQIVDMYMSKMLAGEKIEATRSIFKNLLDWEKSAVDNKEITANANILLAIYTKIDDFLQPAKQILP